MKRYILMLLGCAFWASLSSAQEQVCDDGIWTFCNAPEVACDATTIYVGSWSAKGRPTITALDPLNKDEINSVTLYSAAQLEVNDHNNPAVLPLRSGKILAAFSKHNGESWSTTTSTAADITTFGSLVAANTVSDDAYCQLYQFGDTNDTIFWFHRRWIVDAPYGPQFYRTSTDDGATWSASTEWLRNVNQRPYPRYYRTSDSRLDFVFSTANPNEADLDLYHGYMTIAADGTLAWYQTDGTLVGDIDDLPFAPTDFTLVYQSETLDARIWDVLVLGGTPQCVFATYDRDDQDPHTYMRGTWSGSSWTNEEVCSGGTTEAGDGLVATIPYYSGGIRFDPGSGDIVYVSREYGAGDHRIEQWTKAASWEKTLDISGDTGNTNARPIAVKFGSQTYVFWWQGTYTTYSNYDTQLYVHPALGNLRTSKVATPYADSRWIAPGTRLFLPLQDGSGAPADITANYTPAMTGAVTWGSDAFGGYLTGFATDKYVSFDAAAAAWLAADYPKWLTFIFSLSDATVGQRIFSFGKNTGTTPKLLLGLHYPEANSIKLDIQDDAGANSAVTGTGLTFTDGNRHVLQVINRAANTWDMVLDNTSLGTSTSALGAITWNQATLGVIRRNTVTNPFLGNVYAVAFGWGQRPPNAEQWLDWSAGRFAGVGLEEDPAPATVYQHYHFGLRR